MSLYHLATPHLLSLSLSLSLSQHPHPTEKTLQSSIYNDKSLLNEKRVKPAQVYALVRETARWSVVLAEVVERAGVLGVERKVSLSITIHSSVDPKLGFY